MSNLTGKPSVDRPWLKYYPEQLRQMIKEPKCTVLEYLKSYCPGEDDFYRYFTHDVERDARELVAKRIKRYYATFIYPNR